MALCRQVKVFSLSCSQCVNKFGFLRGPSLRSDPSVQGDWTMLKKSLLSIVALTALCAAIPASAAESNFYGVFSLGRSKIDANSSSVDLYNTTHGFTSSSTSSQTSANGAKAQLGYNLGKTFALEGGYIYLGKADFSSITNLGTIGGSKDAYLFNLDLVAKFPVNEKFSVLGRFGGYYWKTIFLY